MSGVKQLHLAYIALLKIYGRGFRKSCTLGIPLVRVDACSLYFLKSPCREIRTFFGKECVGLSPGLISSIARNVAQQGAAFVVTI